MVLLLYKINSKNLLGDKMEDINKIIGNNLLKLRKNSKLTQLELAEKFNYSDKSISKWENGESLPNIEVLYELATFYGTTLDALTSSEEILSNQKICKTKPNKEHTPRMFPVKLIVTLLAVCAVWICATILFVMLKITLQINYSMCFMWAWCASFIVLTVFISIWGTNKMLFPTISILLWTIIASIHLQLLLYNLNIWPVYFLGIPLQVAIILWGALVKKPFGYYKKLKEQKNTIDEQKESN